jgi:hypothetical protein
VSRTAKVAYVTSQGPTRPHTWHWPGCCRQVPPAMWGCKPHWMALPKQLRDRIWATYEPGRETTITPSAAYLDAARLVQDWITANLGLRVEPARRATQRRPF